jgi:hypothetical protein
VVKTKTFNSNDPDRVTGAPDTLFLPEGSWVIALEQFHENAPLILPGPVLGNPVAIRQFSTLDQWRDYVAGLRLNGNPPEAVERAYEHMLRVLLLAWFDAAVIKLAELAALARLESAIAIRYNKKFRGLEKALEHLVEHGGVTDAALRTFQESGGSIVANLLRKKNGELGSGLSQIRNRLAHGDPFETMPWAGLFEIVRDLIDFMYPRAEAALTR